MSNLEPGAQPAPHEPQALEADRIRSAFGRRYEKAQRAGREIATGIFVAKLNPKRRGAGFRWEGLEALVASFAESMAHQPWSRSEWGRFGALITQITVRAARQQVRKLLADSQVQEWSPCVEVSDE